MKDIDWYVLGDMIYLFCIRQARFIHETFDNASNFGIILHWFGRNMRVLQNMTESCSPGELVYDKSVVTSSFSIDHKFVCDKYYLKGIFNALYMLGMLIGAFLFGIIGL